MNGPVNLKAERLRRGLSQAGLAAKVSEHAGRNVSVDVIAGAEEGRRPQPANAVAIAAFFGFDVLEQWPIPQDVAA